MHGGISIISGIGFCISALKQEGLGFIVIFEDSRGVMGHVVIFRFFGSAPSPSTECIATFCSANLKRDTIAEQKGLPVFTKLFYLGTLLLSHAVTAEKRKTNRTRTLSAKTSFNSNKVLNMLCTERNNSPETMSN